MAFEYKVVPAPTQGVKARGVKTPQDRFALALSQVINAQAAEGWEYLRTDTLPAQERQGLTGRSTVFQNMLVFRRALEAGAMAAAPETEAPAPKLAGVSREEAPLPPASAPRVVARKDDTGKDVAAE